MIDVELKEHTLDLSRPELAGVRRRYGSDFARPQTALLGPPAALIVTEHPGDEEPLRRAMEDEGWFVNTCGGPRVVDCPVMRGEKCSLRASVDAAVVYVEPNQLGGSLGGIPRIRCAADAASPGVVALEGKLTGTTFGPNMACVGALRGPQPILSAISTLLAQKGE